MNFIKEDPSVLVELVLGIVFVIQGAVQALTGKSVNYATYAKKYTKESFERFVRPSGVIMMIEGVLIALFGFSETATGESNILFPICVAGVIICVAVYFYLSKKILVKLK